MEQDDEKTKFYVEMDGRWAQLSGSEQGISALIRKAKEIRPWMLKEQRVHIIHLN